MADMIDGGIIKIGVNVDLDSMKQGLTEAENAAKETAKDIESAAKNIDKSFDKVIKAGDKMKKVGGTLTKFVTLPIAGIAAATVNMAMEAVESENLFAESFGKMADTARAWSEELSEALGLNAYELRKNSGMFYVMLDAMGLTEEASYDMATSITELAADMASFYNIDVETAVMKLRGGLTGEAEGLKEFGIIVNETTVEAYALRTGLIKQGEEMTAQEKVAARYGLIIESTEKAQGDLARTMDSPTNKIRIQKERLKELGIELGTKLMPLADKGIDMLEDVVDWLSALDEEQVEQIIKWGLIAAAAGPALSIMGNMVTVVGGLGKAAGPFIAKMAVGKASIAGAIGTAGSAAGAAGGAAGMGALAGGLGAAALAAAPYVVAGAAVVGTGKLIYDNLTEDVIPAVDLFADEVTVTNETVGGEMASLSGKVETEVVRISEATKTAVQAYIDLDKEATDELNELYISGQKITGDIVTDMTTQFGEMTQTIIDGYTSQKEESIKELNDLFMQSNTITATEQAKILGETQQHYDQKKNVAEEAENRINEILEAASTEKRSLTAEEVQEINRMQFAMKDAAVQALSETEVEARAIQSRLSADKNRINAEGAAEYIAKVNQVRDEAISAAETEYNERVATVIRMRDELGVISAEQADALIRSAEVQKEGTIRAAEDTRSGAIGKFRTLYSDLDKTVNTNTGKVLTKFDQIKRWWSGWKPEGKNFYATITTRSVNTSGTKTVQSRAKGDRDFMGGLTNLHERGYEVYDLPQGTRIFPHEASEQIVEDTVNRLASQYIAGNEPKANQNLLENIGRMIQGALNSGGGNDRPVELVVNLDGKTIARVSEPHISTLQGKNSAFNQLAYGRG